jgi:hypothetical protein
MTIRASKGAREVTAVYSKDDSTLELVIRLPPSYPLRAAEVECTRNMGVTEGRLRKWLLSVSAFLRNTNGAVAEALHLWREVRPRGEKERNKLPRETGGSGSSGRPARGGTRGCLLCGAKRGDLNVSSTLRRLLPTLQAKWVRSGAPAAPRHIAETRRMGLANGDGCGYGDDDD